MIQAIALLSLFLLLNLTYILLYIMTNYGPISHYFLKSSDYGPITINNILLDSIN